jgi:hypothetical protein
MTMGLQFLVQARKVGRGPLSFIDPARGMPEQRLLQPGLIPTLWQRPTDARRLGAFQIL